VDTWSSLSGWLVLAAVDVPVDLVVPGAGEASLMALLQRWEYWTAET
jgi:hypothetical protein